MWSRLFLFAISVMNWVLILVVFSKLLAALVVIFWAAWLRASLIFSTALIFFSVEKEFGLPDKLEESELFSGGKSSLLVMILFI